MSLTAGMSLMEDIIFTYCEPWPGKRRPTGIGGCAGAAGARAAGAAPAMISSSASGKSSAPYFLGSRPCMRAAPGRERNQAFGGALSPHSQQPYCFMLLVGPTGMYQPYFCSFCAVSRSSTQSSQSHSLAKSSAVLPSSGSWPNFMLSFMCTSAFAFRRRATHSACPDWAAYWSAVMLFRCSLRSPLKRLFSSPVARSISSWA
mmetsp:Transcript_106104/g.228573  ORF Transcript_106104/g.228573 Transcript_106104/m.228573 type:complete len:203 (+) Transcript_106104:800-1408(+)